MTPKNRCYDSMMAGALLTLACTVGVHAASIRISGCSWVVGSQVTATNMLVDSSATLGGTGTIHAVTRVSGALNPGCGTNTGVLVFTDNVTFDGGSLNSHASASDQLDQITATGSVSGNGTIDMTRASGVEPVGQIVISGSAASDYSAFSVSPETGWFLDQSGALNLRVTAMAGIVALGTNGGPIANGAAASTAFGTDFGTLSWDKSSTNLFSITNNGLVNLILSGVTTSGTGAAAFDVIGVPTQVLVGAISHFSVIFNPTSAASYAASLTLANNSTNTPYVINLAGIGDLRDQTITFTNPGAQETTNVTVLSASAGSGLPVTFAVVSGTADLSDQSNLTYQTDGTVVISASQTGNANWYAATTVTQSFSVTKVVGSVTLTNLSQTYDGSARSVGSVTSPTGLTVNLTYDGGAAAPTNTGSYTVIGIVSNALYQGGATDTLAVARAFDTITFSHTNQTYDGAAKYVTSNSTHVQPVAMTYNAAATAPINAGVYSVTGTVSTLNWAGTNSTLLTIDKGPQAITFDNPGPQETTNVTVLSASAGSGLPVTFAVVSGPADLSDQSNLTYQTDGTVTISASQAGNSNWHGATSVTQTFTVTKAIATVTLTNLNQTYDGSARSVGSVTSPTGLTVNLTYDGGFAAPTNAGSYTVIGIVSDVIYQGGTTGTLEVGRAPQTITFASISDQFWTNRLALSATSDSGLSVSFAVASGSAVLAGGTNLTFSGIGAVSLTANQVGDMNYLAAPTVSNRFSTTGPQWTLLGTNGAAIISSNTVETTNGTDFGAALVGLQVLTNTFILTNSGNALLTISGIATDGVASAAFQISDFNFEIAPGTSQAFAVLFDPQAGESNTASFTFTFDGTNSPYILNVCGYGQGGGIALSTNALTFNATFQSNNPPAQSFGMTNVGVSRFTFTNISSSAWLIPSPTDGSLTLHGATVLTNAVNVTNLNAGTYTATNSILSFDSTNSPQAMVITLTVDKASQAITFPNPGAQETTNGTVLSASAGSGLPVAFAVVSGPADLSDQSNLTYQTDGTVVISASQAGNSNWYGATSVTQTFTVAKAVATVTLTNLNQTYDGSARSVGSVTSPTGLTVNLTYDGGAAAPTNTGSYTVIGIVSDVIYQGGTTGTLEVSRASQTITFPGIGPQDSTNTTGLSGTSASGLPVSFAVLSGNATLTDLTNLTYQSDGIVLITADQTGNTNWNAAPQVTNSITVNKTHQSALLFSPTNAMIYLTTNVLSASGGSGTGAVTYAVQDGPGAIVNSYYLSVNSGSGVVTVVATKALDDLYSATTATAMVSCVRADQTIDFPSIADQAITNTLALSATAGSGLPITFTVASGTADLSDQSNLTYRATGVVVIAASQAGDTNWNAAANATNTFNVYPVLPTVTTLPASSVGQTTAGSGGNVTFNGGAPVTQRGLCWNLVGTPTTASSLTRDGRGTGAYASVARGLSQSTTYYLRAYAINEVGTSYGNEISVTTSNTPPAPPAPDGFTWTGAADDQWANAANWYGGVVPYATNYARFYTTNCTEFTIDLNGDREALGIVVQSNVADYVYFAGGSLLLTNADSILMISTNALGFEQPLVVGADHAMACSAGAQIILEAGLVADGDVEKAGAGTLGLSVASLLGGDMTIAGGALYGSGDLALSGGGAVGIAEGASLYPRDYAAPVFPGTLTITNDTPGTPSLVIGGTLSYGIVATACDELDLNENILALGSNSVLDVSILFGAIDVTNTYTLATYAAITGRFAQVNGLSAHTLNYGTNALTLDPTFVWEGSVNSNWSEGLNWLNSGGATPGTESDAGFRVDDADIVVQLDTNPSVRSTRAAGLGMVTLNNPAATLTLTNASVRSGEIPALSAQDGVTLHVYSAIETVPGARILAQGSMFPAVIALFGGIAIQDGTGHLVFDGLGDVELMDDTVFAGVDNQLELRGPSLFTGRAGALGANGLILTNGGRLVATNDMVVEVPISLTGNGGLAALHSNDTLIVSNNLTGTGLLTITGDGTVILTGSNRVGAVNVESGRLLVQGSMQSEGQVNVQEGESFGGRGSVGIDSSAFLLHIRSGAHLTPGASIGTLTVEGSLTVEGGWTVEVDNDSNDVVHVRDTLTLGAGSTLTVTGTPDGVTPYVFATFASRSGVFGGVTVPQNYVLTYGDTNLSLMPRGNEMGRTNIVREGGTVNIPVTEDSNTTWSVANTSSWITVTSGTGGTGTGTVTLVISANDGRERTGIVWIAGRQYIVTQRANRAVYLDFDGDAKADITVFEPETGCWHILQSSLNTGRVQPWGWPESVPTPGDYDGDGLFDVAVYCATNGTWYIWKSDSQSARVQAWGFENVIPVPADYDGDGITDVAVYDAASGLWYIWQSATQAARTKPWGWSGAVPVPGDYDGDGLCDVAVYEPENGLWYIWQSATQTARTQPWGWAEAEPIPGDYDGDGLTDVAVYWPENGAWYAWLSATQTGATDHWGWNAAWPVPADYDGDWKFDRTVYVPTEGQWYLWQSATQTPRTQPWGFEQAEPVNY